MGLMDLLRRNGAGADPRDVGVFIEEPEEGYQVVDEYHVKEPFSKVSIFKSAKLGERTSMRPTRRWLRSSARS